MEHYLKTRRRPTETVYYGEANTGYGNVDLESRDEDALRVVMEAIDNYEDLQDKCTKLLAACEGLVDLAIWMSGSSSFSPGGEAHEGWMNLRGAIDKGKAAITDQADSVS